MSIIVDSVIQNYHITRKIGEGGMGEVYLAEEVLLGRQVAIKSLNPNLTSDSQFSERFVNEARIQAKLIHPNIVALYNFFIEDGIYYMVMEYAGGITLKDLIAKNGPIPEKRTKQIFNQVINALSYAHSKKIIHRDIKPSNIMIDETDNVKVMDFGIARIMSDKHLTRTGAKLGTLYYMSPEQVRADKNIDHLTDIYSTGIVLYEMLTGKLPYKTDTDSDFYVMKEILEDATPDPRDFYPHISEDMVSLVGRMTQKDKNDRIEIHNINNTGDIRSDDNKDIPHPHAIIKNQKSIPPEKIAYVNSVPLQRLEHELQKASNIGDDELVDLLMNRLDSKQEEEDQDQDQDSADLLLAASEGVIEKVKSLLDSGERVDSVDPDGLTALMFAAEKGHADCVRLLIDRGANINLVSSNGWTALDMAITNHHDEVAAILRKYGAENGNGQNGKFGFVKSAFIVIIVFDIFTLFVIFSMIRCSSG